MASYLAPNFLERLNVFEEVMTGSWANFKCQFLAHPKPEVQWFKDDQQICSDDRISINETFPGEAGTALCLKISRVTKEDEGAYRCSVENSEGVASTTGYLSVTDLSAKITDPEPLDRSLINSLLLRSLSDDEDKKPQRAKENVMPDRSSIDKLSKNHDNFDGETDTSEHLSEIESIMTRIFANSIEIDKPHQNVEKKGNLQPEQEEVKDNKGNQTTVNIFTIMNSENNLHDSFKPIEINKLSIVRGYSPNPTNDVHTPKTTAESHNDQPTFSTINNISNMGNISNISYEEIARTPASESRPDEVEDEQFNDERKEKANDGSTSSIESHENHPETQQAQVIEQTNESPKHISFSDYENNPDNKICRVCFHSSKQPSESGEHRGLESILGRKLSVSPVRDGTGTEHYKFLKTPLPLQRSKSSELELKPSKSMKWLKTNRVSNGSTNKSKRNSDVYKSDPNLIICKKRVRPGRKVCCSIDTSISSVFIDCLSTISAPPPTPDIPFFYQGDNELLTPDAKKTSGSKITWNNAITKLFVFPQVLSVFFILIATMFFVYHQINPFLVTIIVSLFWTMAIHVVPTLSELISK